MSEIYNRSQWAHDIFHVNKAGAMERLCILRNFYCLQGHITSNNNGERQGQGKEHHDGETAASSKTITSPHDTC